MCEQRTIQLPSHDVLSRLARENPERFEVLRRSLIEQRIESAPERIRPRLRQLQFRVDGIRRRSSSPLGAAMKIQALMWESFLQMNEKLQAFSSRRPRQCPAYRSVFAVGPRQCQVQSARIFDFRPRQVV